MINVSLLLSLLLKLLVIPAVVALIAWWIRSRPHRARRAGKRLRLPKIIAVIGWVFVPVGLLMLVVAMGDAPGDPEHIPMSVMALAIILGGIAFLVAYVNWYVAFTDEGIEARTAWGVRREIPYSRIESCRLVESRTGTMLIMRSTSGETLRVNLLFHDATPMLARLAFREQRGRWPLPGELTSGTAAG